MSTYTSGYPLQQVVSALEPTAPAPGRGKAQVEIHSKHISSTEKSTGGRYYSGLMPENTYQSYLLTRTLGIGWVIFITPSFSNY